MESPSSKDMESSASKEWYNFSVEWDSYVYKVTPYNCCTDGSMVAQRYASALSPFAVANTRRINLDYVEYNCDENPIEIMAEKTYRLYNSVRNSKLLQHENIVIGGAHPTAVYLAEVLHAPLLPGGFLALAKDWAEAGKMTDSGKRGLTLVGGDHDYGRLWLWMKINEQIPTAYQKILECAKNCLIMRTTDGHTGTEVKGIYKNLYVTTATPQNLFEEVKNQMTPLKSSDVDHLRQWEWGLPDSTINAFKNYWTNTLKRSLDTFHIIEKNTIDLYKAAPRLWTKYLKHNGKPIRGFTFNSYWSAHPSYERGAGLVPFQYYRFEADDFKTMSDFTRRKIMEIKKSLHMNFEDQKQSTLCVFANDVGGENDVTRLAKFIQSLELGLEQKAWFSKGYDCPGSVNKDMFGYPVPLPSEKIADWMRDESNTPYITSEFYPLAIDEVVKIFESDSSI